MGITSNTTTVSEAQGKRARALEEAERLARTGRDPRNAFKQEDLEWLFGNDPEALDRLSALAAEAVQERVRRHQAIAEKDRLNAAIDGILAEQDREALAERRKAAEKIARERLGMEPS